MRVLEATERILRVEDDRRAEDPPGFRRSVLFAFLFFAVPFAVLTILIGGIDALRDASGSLIAIGLTIAGAYGLFRLADRATGGRIVYTFDKDTGTFSVTQRARKLRTLVLTDIIDTDIEESQPARGESPSRIVLYLSIGGIVPLPEAFSSGRADHEALERAVRDFLGITDLPDEPEDDTIPEDAISERRRWK